MKTRLNSVFVCFLPLFLLFFVTGCIAEQESSNFTNGEMVVDATVATFVTVTPLPTPTPTIFSEFSEPVNVLPEEFKTIMHSTDCDRPCYLGLMVGQTKDEVLEILDELGAVNIQVRLEEDEDGFTAIRWEWKEPFLYRGYPLQSESGVSFYDSRALFLGVAQLDNAVIPISLIIDEFGPPPYVSTWGDSDFRGFVLFYLHNDTVIEFGTWHYGTVAQTLTGDSLLKSLYMERVDSYFPWECEYGVTKFQDWKGYGGQGVYYNEYGHSQHETSPLDCANWEE